MGYIECIKCKQRTTLKYWVFTPPIPGFNKQKCFNHQTAKVRKLITLYTKKNRKRK